MSHSVLPVSPPVPLSEPQAHAVLDAAVWQSLSGPEHARLSEGDDLVRRYREGVSPFVAVRDVSDPRTWDALLALVGPGAAVPLVVDPADVPESWEAGEAAVINSENLHRRLPVPPGGDELGRLAATLNAMLDDIDAVQRSQRRFVADASHELRSPLASLRQSAETARRRPEGTTVEELADRVLVQELRMEELVGSLLTLARLENAPVLTRGPVDLDDLVTAEVQRRRAEGDAMTFDVSRVSAGQVAADPVLLSQVVANLLANAARHARAVVVVSLAETGSDVLLVVEDDGEGVPLEHRESIFDRFARLDEGRARDAGGSGLGLAIVRSVVEAFDGEVRVEAGRTGGARFVVRLPRAA